jgi:deoxyribonuclease V
MFLAVLHKCEAVIGMEIKKLHNWNMSYSEAIALQKQLSDKVQLIKLENQPKTIAGIDCALSKNGQRIVAAAIVLKLQTAQKSLWGPVESYNFEIIETTNATEKLTFPYIPGLLSFRESPVCIAAVEKLQTQPDAFIIDGQGIAHPRRFGLASHLGLFFDKPTIGCAKSRLTGTYEEPHAEKGSFSPLQDGDETIGAVVRTRTNVEPVFVSVGNKCMLENAIKITLACTTKYRIPEPTRLAHQFVSKIKLKV